MKQTNKKEFSKFLSKFEKLLDHNFDVLAYETTLNLFNGKTENFLKTSHCKFSLSTESGQIIFKLLFFDKNKNEIFSKTIGCSQKFEILSSKGLLRLPKKSSKKVLVRPTTSIISKMSSIPNTSLFFTSNTTPKGG